MNKFFKITAVAVVTFTAAGVFAAPPPRHHNHNNGIRLATDIINLVDSSLRLLTGTPHTITVATPVPVYTAPVYTAPVYTPAPIVINTPPPPPRPVIINRRPAPPPKPVNRHHNNHRPAPRPGHRR